MRHRVLPAATAAVALLALMPATSFAQSSTHLLIIDQDAGPVNDDSAGALFNLDLQQATNAPPLVEAAADLGAPFELISGVAFSPVDGRAYIADLGTDSVPPFTPIGRIFAVDAAGVVETIWEGAPLVQPFSLAFKPDGTLLIADPEADPSFLGTGGGCGAPGAIFSIDTATCTAPCAPTLLSDGTQHPFSATIPTVFGEPLGIAYDPVRDRIYVADSCASVLGWAGSLYSVNPASGRVALISSTDRFVSLISVGVRPDGTPLIADQGAVAGDSLVWTIDLANTDPEANAAELTAGTQYSVIQDVAVDASNTVYLVDWGDYDLSTNTYIAPPAIWRVDETNTNPGTNGVLVNDSSEWYTPVSGALVPIPVATSMTPSVITGPMNVVIQGTNLNSSLILDLGPGIAVSNVDNAPGYPVGTAIQAVLTPLSSAVVPFGCAGALDLELTQPFGGSGILPNAGTLVANTGGIFPAAPFSTRGDANRDGIVDGLDLAILGLHFGAAYCDGFAFWNDADFNDDDLIDGSDLARLAAYFGTRP